MEFIYFLGGEKPFITKLDILDLDDLYLHEEVVETHVKRLYNSLRSEKVLRNPILVDVNSNVVLDGTHRVYVLRMMGYKRIPAVLVDYTDDRIELKRWFRVLEGDETEIMKILKKHNFYEHDLDDLSFNSRNMIIALIGESAYVVAEKNSVVELYKKLSLLEKELVKSGVKVKYVTARDALRAWKKGFSIIVTPSISKEDVISTAKANILYPPKTTRHVFPIRPLFLDFYLENLKKNFSKDLLKEILREHILGKTYLKINGKITVDRFYEEDKLILFI